MKYPIRMKSKRTGAIVEFISLCHGIVIDGGNTSIKVGFESRFFSPCTEKETWKKVIQE